MTDRSPLGQRLSLAFAAYFVVLIAGVFYLRHFALDTGLTMNFDRSIFWSINAATLTGFRLSPNGLGDFSTPGLIGVYALMSFGAIFTMTVGGTLVSRLAGMRHSFSSLLVGAISLMAAAAFAGAGMLMTPGRSFGAAIFEATSVFANCGMSYDGPRTLSDWRLPVVIAPLAALGGLGLPVLLDLFDRCTARRPISEYSRRALALVLTSWIAAAVILFAANFWSPLRSNVLESWFYAINTRSLGLDVVVDGTIPRVMWWVMALLMLVGQMPGGTTSGIGLLPLSTIWRGSVWHERPTYSEAVQRAVSWVMLAALMALMMFLMLMSAEPQLSPDRLVVMACGAVSNTGLSQDALSMSTRGLMLVSVGMLAGYLLPLRFLWLVL